MKACATVRRQPRNCASICGRRRNGLIRMAADNGSDCQGYPGATCRFDVVRGVPQLQKRMSRALRDPKVSTRTSIFLQQMMDATDSFGRSVKAGDFTGGDATKAYAYKRVARRDMEAAQEKSNIEQTHRTGREQGQGPVHAVGLHQCHQDRVSATVSAHRQGTGKRLDQGRDRRHQAVGRGRF